MILGATALALAGFYGIRKSVPRDPGVCKERTTEGSEKMIKTSLPIWESVTRHLIRI